jgi:2-amino-4-hydroxy-6-hydroxymethyldihydropteridine diphosphokinase
MKITYLSLGSNLGDRAANLERAIAALREVGVNILRRSSLYATEAVDLPRQQWFLNCVVEAETSLMPLQLLHATQGIERSLGGRKLVARGPRVIDLDILLYGASVIRTKELEVPHPRLRHPALGATIADLLGAARDASQIRTWTPPAGATTTA